MRERGAGVRTKEQDGGGEGLSALLIVIAIVFRPVRPLSFSVYFLSVCLWVCFCLSLWFVLWVIGGGVCAQVSIDCVVCVVSVVGRMRMRRVGLVIMG